MPTVIISTYSKFYDAEKDIQFNAVLDPRTGCFVAAAHVDEETAAHYADRGAFEVLSDDEFAERQEPPAEPEPEPSATGDPLTDQANKADQADKSDTTSSNSLDGPPPPKSK